MTVSEAIIKWLKEFNPEDYWKMKQIHTDMQSPTVDSYSLAKEPVRNVKTYLSGKKIFTDHYIINARLASNNDDDRIVNNGFGEALEDWVMKQNRNSNFPILTGAVVSDINITTPFYMGKTETNNSVYQMTVAIKYVKEI